MTSPALRRERECSGKQWADCEALCQAAVVWGRVPGLAGSGGANWEPSRRPVICKAWPMGCVQTQMLWLQDTWVPTSFPEAPGSWP